MKRGGKLARWLTAIAVVVVAWSVMNALNSSRMKDEGVAKVSNLVGTEWCEDLDHESDGNGDYVTFGGHDCTTISQVSGVEFVQMSGRSNLCAQVSIDLEQGPRGSGLVQRNYKSGRFCVPKGVLGYSAVDMRQDVFKFIRGL